MDQNQIGKLETLDKRRSRGIETRNQILASAITSIATRGLGKTTLDRVAESANVSRALVVFHFKSKNQLFAAVLEYMGKAFNTGWDAVAFRQHASPMEKLTDLVEYDVRFAYQNPEYVSAWAAFWGEAKGSNLYAEHSAPRDARYEKVFQNLIAEQLESEGRSREQVPYVSHALFCMLYGIWMSSHLKPDPDGLEYSLASARTFLNNAFPKC